MTTNEAQKYTREVISYLDEVSNVGGLSDPILLRGWYRRVSRVAGSTTLGEPMCLRGVRTWPL